MRTSSIVLILSLFISLNSFSGGDNGGSGGGGPSIILRTLDDTDIRVISGGHWDVNQLGEDILVIPDVENSIWNLRLELVAPEGSAKEIKLERLIIDGHLEVTNREKSLMEYSLEWREAESSREWKTPYASFR